MNTPFVTSSSRLSIAEQYHSHLLSATFPRVAANQHPESIGSTVTTTPIEVSHRPKASSSFDDLTHARQAFSSGRLPVSSSTNVHNK
ncbi:hypothetical protein ABVK25_004569 [Lepraria finkii]|uniref:Uncharacterized protein n=1 Tax=Lepraria finkii TaxID=1340010 RepID=A0ABR4BEF1_9LECA